MIKTMLVPLDGSQMAEEALDVAIELARGLNGKITLLRVVPPIVPGRFYAPNMLEELREAQVREAEAYLQELMALQAQDGVISKTSVMTGEAADTIIKSGEAEHCDLIVMGSHGLGGRGWQVFGSVAQKVLHSAKSPVLIVKPNQAAWEREEEEEEARDDEAMIGQLTQTQAGKES
jgi:nucleotide-binding universal stress UspA family protein